MLIHPWDEALTPDEWRTWLAAGRDFGQLCAVGTDGWPLVVPTHFVLDGDSVLVHLARPNPLWKALESSPRLLLTVVDDYAFIPTTWRAAPDVPPENGVPTSYYATVQLRCTAEVLDDPTEKAALLRRQLEHFQPEADHGPVTPDGPPYGRMLAGIRGLRLHVVRATAKFKFDDHKSSEHRTAVASRLRLRGTGRDHQAGEQQLRRLAATEGRRPN